MSSDWARLGALVTAERARQHRSVAGFARAIGLSKTTVDSIENHRRTSYDATTVAAIEHAMGWQPGSVERVLSGLEPMLVADPDLTAVIDAWPNLSPSARRMLRILAVEGGRAELNEDGR